MKKKLLILLSISLIACQNKSKEVSTEAETISETVETPVTNEERFTESIEKAHYKEDFTQKDAVQFDIYLNFGGANRLDATITMLTNSTKIRIDKKDGSSLLYNGKEVYLSPSETNERGARFDMFTWTYFFALPYKLNDKGTVWNLLDDLALEEKTYKAAKLSFEGSIGDAPDDWYVVYADKESNLVTAAGYIVTFGGNAVENAEKDPHAIKYSNYEKIDGVPIAKTWTYYEWTTENGFTNEIGDATLSNIKFITPEVNFFQKSIDSKEIKL